MSLSICALPGNERYADDLRARLGAGALEFESRRFPDGESYVRLAGDCWGRDIAFVCTLNDPDAKALRLLFAARTARELGARRVGLVAPYLAYMRQDRRFRDGEAVTSVQFAALVSSTFDWLVTVDPHLHRRAAIADLYPIPVEIVRAAPLLAAWIRERVPEPLIVGPDAESEQWAAVVGDGAGAPHVALEKKRHGDREVEISLPDLERWRGRTPVLVDDIISTGRTMTTAATGLRERGFAAPWCVAVHAVFAGDAQRELEAAGCSAIATTDTITHPSNAMTTAGLVADAIARLAA
jgi:ribose-phosphate pyrophosphokinase